MESRREREAKVRRLKARLGLPHTPQSLHNRIPMQTDTSPARFIQTLPNQAREIKDSAINERLSSLLTR